MILSLGTSLNSRKPSRDHAGPSVNRKPVATRSISMSGASCAAAGRPSTPSIETPNPRRVMRISLLRGELDFVDDFLDAVYFFGEPLRLLFQLVGFHLAAQRDHAVFDVDFERAAFDVRIVRQFPLHQIVNRIVGQPLVSEVKTRALK